MLLLLLLFFFFSLEFRRVFCVLVLVTDDELASVCLFSLRCLVRKKNKKKKKTSSSSSSRWVFNKHWLTDTTKTTHSTNQINRILLLSPTMRIEAFAASFLSCGVLLLSFPVDCWIVSLLYATDTERERAPNPVPEFLQIRLVLVLVPIVVLLRHQIFPLFCGRSRFFGAAIYIFLQQTL